MSTTVAASPSTRSVARAVFFPLPPPRSIPSTWTKFRAFTPRSACGIGPHPSTFDLASDALYSFGEKRAGTLGGLDEVSDASDTVQIEDSSRDSHASRPGL